MLCALLNVTFPSAAAEFDDPLNTPARDQSHIAQRPITAIARAGDRLVAAGPRGLIIVSDDAGENWQQAKVPVQSDLVALHFANENKGWAVGHDGLILYSEDGGNTWAKQLDGRIAKVRFTQYYKERLKSETDNAEAALGLIERNFNEGPALPYLDVWFADEHQGFVVGAFGKFAVTDDGGQTWLPAVHMIDNLRPALSLYQIENINGDVNIAAERGVIFKLDSEQTRFQRIDTNSTGTFFGMTGNKKVVVAYGVSGTFYRSEDGGQSWEAVSVPIESNINFGIRRRDGGGFVFGTQEGDLLLTDELARQFQIVSLDQLMVLSSAASLSDGHAIIAGRQGIQRQSLPASPETQAIAE